MDDPIPRETVVQIAQNMRELMLLHKQQASTQAAMIRTCLTALKREPGAFADAADRRKIRDDKNRALAALAELAQMLEDQSVTSRDDQPKETDHVHGSSSVPLCGPSD